MGLQRDLHRQGNLLVFEDSPAPLARRPSGYANKKLRTPFRQGASVSPRVLLVVGEIADGLRTREVTVTTVRSKQKPWKELEPQTGVVPAHWVRELLTSNQMFVFVTLRELPRAIVPTDAGGRLEEAPGHLSPFWRDLDVAYDEFCGRGRNTPETLIAQLDHNGKLSGHLMRARTRRTLVLYPKSGDIMRAARSQAGAFGVDGTLYYFSAASAGSHGTCWR